MLDYSSSSKAGNLFQEWGFRDNPFSHNELPSNSDGDRLLIGRDEEVSLLLRRLSTPPSVVTLEATAGMGKSSLVNVALYRYMRLRAKQGIGPLLIPCKKKFELYPGTITEDWIRKFYVSLAETLVAERAFLEELGYKIAEMSRIDDFLNVIEKVGRTVAVSAAAYGRTPSPTSNLYSESGFYRDVEAALKTIFPEQKSGGVVCIIENLELVEFFEDARRKLEQLRDEVLNMRGVRWVISGAIGLLYGLVATPRLGRVLDPPLRLKPIPLKEAADVLRSREEVFKEENDFYLPLTPDMMPELFELMHGNIGAVLRSVEDYCKWIDSNGHHPKEPRRKYAYFKKWLMEKSLVHLDEIQRWIDNPGTWKVFEEISLSGGRGYMKLLTGKKGRGAVEDAYSYTDPNESHRRMRIVNELKNLDLVKQVYERGDSKGALLEVTPKGWLVMYAKRSVVPSKQPSNAPPDKS